MSGNAAGCGGSMGGVPTIGRFFGISIAMFFDDHGPPPFPRPPWAGQREGSDRLARIGRDLHDGTQQRLVSIAMTLGLAESKLASDPQAIGPVLRGAREALALALEELRDLTQGIRPAILVLVDPGHILFESVQVNGGWVGR
jgi:Histidine kinase